jgi:hypothetical protein
MLVASQKRDRVRVTLMMRPSDWIPSSPPDIDTLVRPLEVDVPVTVSDAHNAKRVQLFEQAPI